VAFSNNPQFSTYKQEVLEFDATPFYRSGDLSIQRDSQIINMYYDRISEENKQRNVILKKRPGLTTTTYNLTKSSASDVLRGSYYDVDQNTWYWAVNDKVYSISPDVGTSVRTVATLAGSSGYVGFCPFLKSDGTRYVIFTDGTDLWVDDYATTTCTEVTDVDLPSPHQPYPIYLNGYLFLIKSGTSQIWNSANDDPFAWTADSFIDAEINSDRALVLAKAKNYLICMGTNSVEYFWDAGVAPPSSPLERNDSPVRQVGYISGFSQIGDTTYFVGQDEKQSISVYAVNSFKIEPISNNVVDRTLQPFSSTQNTKGDMPLNKNGYAISIDGHDFYVLVTGQTTWVYDIKDKFWYEWKGSDNTGLKIEGVFNMFNGGCYLAISGQTFVSILSQKIYQDFGTNFTCQYTTEDYNAGTMNWKVLNKAQLVCSKHLSTGTSLALLLYSPDDWSPDGVSGTRNINVFSNSPYTTKFGRFRNMSFRIQYTDNYPFFMSKLILDMNIMGV
jgi:Phage stabilisation protein